jgi:hypothetical protein
LWIKLVAGPGGVGSTIATTVNIIEHNPGERKRKEQRGKNDQGREVKSSSNGSEQMEGSAKKKPKCFSCGGEHYSNNCPEF